MLPFPDIGPTVVEIGAFQIRWYALAYVFSFVLGYIFIRRTQKQRGLKLSKEAYESLVFLLMVGVIVGGRLGYVLFYDLGYYLHHPLRIILPFNFDNGFTFTGIMGMSFHGGALMAVLLGIWFARKHKISFFRLADPVLPWAAIGLALGRLGNFINGELYGRVTASRLGMIFPDAQGVPLQGEQTQRVLGELGWSVNQTAGTVTTAAGDTLSNLLHRGWDNAGQYATLINLPRHPSQLYEAFSEGILMAVIMFVILRYVYRDGIAFWTFVGFYGLFRFLIEFVRQPDAHLGFVLGPLTMGQLLSSAMIIAGVVGLWLRFRARETSDAI
ncbi:MAG: prolipoprotein diacylglyceryl transferase [Candidatus Cloacimonetes bacterium]|nr:prolipoprotein diacylglyceryl transferase [Candidatus Cloacimonadota bacterium]